MASEEQYLDDLLNNAINSEPKERSMKDVMRKMGIVIEEPAAEEIPMPEADLTMPELQEAPLAEDISSVDLDDMLSQLEGMEVSDNSVSLDETVPVEEPVIEETTSESVTPEISAITQETLADMLDVLDDPSTYMNEVVPDISIEELSAALETPVQEEIPAVEEVSQPEVTLADEIGQDDLDAMLAGFDMPEAASTVEETPVIEDIPVMEEAPIMEDIPVMEEAPIMEDIPAMEEAPIMEDIPVMEEAPIMEDIPVMEEAPIMEDIPVMEEAPIMEDIPVMEEAPIMEDIPAIEEPIIEEPAPAPAAESAPMGKMSQEEMDALISGMTGGDAPAEESAVEEPIIEEPIIEEPAVEEPIIEEPVIEEPSGSVSDNPSDDELLKMLGEATTAEDFVMPESRLTDTAESDINISDEIIFDEIPTDEIPTDEISMDEIPTEGAAEEIATDENAVVNEAPLDLDVGNATQDELMAMLAGLGLDDTPAEEATSEPEANAESDAAGAESQDDLANMLNGIDEGIGDSEAAGSMEDAPVDLNDVEKLEAAGESDEDLLALLEGIDPTAANDVSSEPSQIIEPYEADGKLPKPKKKKKGFSLPLFGKKKKKGAEESDMPEGDGVIIGTDEEIDDILAGMNEAENQDAPEENADGIQEVDLAEAMGDFDELAGIKEKKKPGFFARLLAFLTEDLDEEETTAGAALDEMSNDDILAEVDAEAAAVEEKKNKKAKKDKKGKKKAAASESSEAGEDGEEGEEGAADNGKKKKKKEKKVKEPKEPKPKEPKKIVLSKKANLGLFCFCVTIIAAVVILSNILPDYIEKNAARKAYYQGDYRTVYENFMNKQLNDSDTIIFKRAETIMKLQRRLDSYNNRIAMGQDAQALDSLLEGVYVYNKLSADDTVDVVNDLTPIYMQIVDILQNKYNLSAQEAVSIYDIEDDTEYTRILFEIVRTGVYTLSVPESEDITEQSIEENAEQISDENVEQNADESDDAGENTDETPAEPVRDDSNYRTIELEDMLPQEEDLL